MGKDLNWQPFPLPKREGKYMVRRNGQVRDVVITAEPEEGLDVWLDQICADAEGDGWNEVGLDEALAEAREDGTIWTVSFGPGEEYGIEEMTASSDAEWVLKE